MRIIILLVIIGFFASCDSDRSNYVVSNDQSESTLTSSLRSQGAEFRFSLPEGASIGFKLTHDQEMWYFYHKEIEETGSSQIQPPSENPFPDGTDVSELVIVCIANGNEGGSDCYGIYGISDCGDLDVENDDDGDTCCTSMDDCGCNCTDW